MKKILLLSTMICARLALADANSAANSPAANIAPRADQLVIEQRAVVARPLTLQLRQSEQPAAGIEIRVAYRQNAHQALQHQQLIGPSDARGRIKWTPKEAGVVVMTWPGGHKNISVFYDGLPWSGLVVMLFAGFLLLGGTVFFFAQMLRDNNE